jgi:hypothetical protein
MNSTCRFTSSRYSVTTLTQLALFISNPVLPNPMQVDCSQSASPIQYTATLLRGFPLLDRF